MELLSIGQRPSGLISTLDPPGAKPQISLKSNSIPSQSNLHRQIRYLILTSDKNSRNRSLWGEHSVPRMPFYSTRKIPHSPEVKPTGL